MKVGCFVSVIIPVYNDPERIRKALDALVAQTYPRDLYEIIVADNGSTDATPQVIEEYCQQSPNLVQMVVENEIQSSYAARNKGLRQAKGTILAFIDSDCIPARDWIEAGVRALQEHGASCGGGRINFFFKSERPNVYEYFDSVRKLTQKSYIENAGFAATANFFVRRELFDRYGEFRFDLISGGDYEFGRRLTTAGEKMIYIPEAMIMHPARTSFKEILTKTKRVAAGQKQLSTLGLLNHGRLSWRNWLPALGYPRDGDWSSGHFFIEKLQLVLLANILRYINLWIRIR